MIGENKKEWDKRIVLFWNSLIVGNKNLTKIDLRKWDVLVHETRKNGVELAFGSVG